MRCGPSVVHGNMLREEMALRVSAMRALRDAGWTVRKIADVFKSNDTTVRNILHGRTWRNVA